MTTSAFHDKELSAAQRALLERRLSGASGKVREIPTRPLDEPVPLSPAQQWLWMVDQTLSDPALSSVHREIWLRGRLDVGLLRRGLDELVRRHEILRTTYRGDAEVVQTIGPSDGAAFQLVDFVAVGEESTMSGRDRAIEAARAELDRPFDLVNGPVFRATLFRAGEDEHLLVLTMHHILSDGWSCRVLGRELAALYNAFARRVPLDLPELPIQYADYAHWQAKRVAGRLRERQLGYWRNALGKVAPVLQLPTDKDYPAQQSYRAEQILRELSPEQTAAVRDLAKGHGVTLFTVMLAAFAVVLQRCAGQDSFAIGAVTSGRGVVEVEHLIGLFINPVAIPADLAGDPTFGELLDRMHRAVLGAIDHRDIPFEQVVAAVQPPRDPARNPLFQVAFQLIEHGEENWGFDGLDVDVVDLHSDTGRADLAFVALDRGDRIELEIKYATELFEPVTAARWGERVMAVIDQVVADPYRPVSVVDILPAAERAFVTSGVNLVSPNRPVYVLDERLEPMPIGVPGELWIGGFGSRRGQLDATDLPVDGVVPDPFGASSGAYMYRVGYLARFDHDGDLRCLGRLDHQVEIAGHRVNLHVIETQLRMHPGVREAAVAARPGQAGEPRLVGYLVATDEIRIADVREALVRTLPNYMIPTAWMVLPELPRTEYGWVDHDALRDPSGSDEYGTVGHVAARTPIEAVLADIWARTLGLDKVGVHDDFFELGGDSIFATEIIAQARRAGLKFSVQQLFEWRSIGRLAEVTSEIGH